MRQAMKAAAALLALFIAGCFVPAGSALAQRDGHQRQGAAPSMSQDERQRMREEMREVYRERNAERGASPQGAMRPPERPRPMSPEEREKLRRDVQNANREMRR